MNKKILVCGGAGYIGSHIVKFLIKQSYFPVVLDNFSTGHKKAVLADVPVYQGDIRDTNFVIKVLNYEQITTVLHFAASSLVSESTIKPYKYFNNNVSGTLSLLEAMRIVGVKQIVFSSSAAVYGNPVTIPIPNDHSLAPINAYGESKFFIERILARYAEAYSFSSVSLRYFNACGAWPDGHLGEMHFPETHLIPIILQTVLGQRKKVLIFGDDYDTKDGTPIRDYIHVVDLSKAHILALEYLEQFSGAYHFNLGNGQGFSVLEVIKTAEKVTGKTIPIEVSARRPGDPAILVADSSDANREFNWQPQYSTLEEMIEDAWRWHRKHPQGY